MIGEGAGYSSSKRRVGHNSTRIVRRDYMHLHVIHIAVQLFDLHLYLLYLLYLLYRQISLNSIHTIQILSPNAAGT